MLEVITINGKKYISYENHQEIVNYTVLDIIQEYQKQINILYDEIDDLKARLNR